jgi:hypothetical protein
MQEARKRAESRLSWLAIGGLVANWIFWATILIHSGTDPRRYDGFRFRHGPPAEWTFPIDEVARCLGVMAIEVVVLVFLVRIMRSFVVAACLGLGLVCGVVSFFMLVLSMHAPAPFSIHGGSLLFAAGWLILMAILSGVAMLGAREREAEGQLRIPPPPQARVVRGGR